jgi:predicted GNAT family acetyltransferase
MGKKTLLQSVANVRAELGVNKMWTHHEYRRKGYAAKLIDAARAHLCLGMLFSS